jgi:hypothetical protein
VEVQEGVAALLLPDFFLGRGNMVARSYEVTEPLLVLEVLHDLADHSDEHGANVYGWSRPKRVIFASSSCREIVNCNCDWTSPSIHVRFPTRTTLDLVVIIRIIIIIVIDFVVVMVL